MTDATRLVTQCSGCMEDVVLDLLNRTATVSVPSNGLRGSKHVPAHTAESPLSGERDGLLMWDCPVCDHADSFDTTLEA